MENLEKEKPTTTIIVDKDQIDTLIIALNDCAKVCKDRLSNIHSNELKDYILGKIREKHYGNSGSHSYSFEERKILDHKVQAEYGKWQENLKQSESLAKFTLEQIPGIMKEIKEVYPELEERDASIEKGNIITDLTDKSTSLPKPTWHGES